jgi:quercetin dioxygenase-like cupin family protein
VYTRFVWSGLLVVALVLALGASADTQQTPSPAPAPAAAPAGGRGDFSSNFTGKITVGTTTEMRTSRIRFEAGARTVWHIHNTPQLLLIEEGRGRMQELGSEVRELLPGQPVITKPNVLHWHGAAPDQPAVQFSVFSGMLEWKHPVTDEEYLGKKK